LIDYHASLNTKLDIPCVIEYLIQLDALQNTENVIQWAAENTVVHIRYCKTRFFRVPFISRISRAWQVRKNNGPRKFEYSSISV